jgi:zinc transport system ATP-binding protein
MTDKRKKLIELKNVSAGYNGDVIIENVNFTVFDDDFIGVIGPNGGGKTTLIKVILGLIKPYRGSIKYHFDVDKYNQNMGYLPQVNTTDRKFPVSVWDVVLSGFFSKNTILKKFSPDQKKKAEQIMEEMGILQLKKKPIGELSGGQLQRVFLCRAIISNPKLLILDEPNSFVDNQFENELYRILHKLSESLSIIIVSHDVGTISSYIKTIVCVNREVHYHESNIISEEQLKSYNCPIQLVTHGKIPHTVLHNH